MDGKPNANFLFASDTVGEGSVVDFEQQFLDLLPEYSNMWPNEYT